MEKNTYFYSFKLLSVYTLQENHSLGNDWKVSILSPCYTFLKAFNAFARAMDFMILGPAALLGVYFKPNTQLKNVDRKWLDPFATRQIWESLKVSFSLVSLNKRKQTYNINAAFKFTYRTIISTMIPICKGIHFKNENHSKMLPGHLWSVSDVSPPGHAKTIFKTLCSNNDALITPSFNDQEQWLLRHIEISCLFKVIQFLSSAHHRDCSQDSDSRALWNDVNSTGIGTLYMAKGLT